jgi:hypothetical protein
VLFLIPLQLCICFVICPSLSCFSSHVFHLCCCYSSGSITVIVQVSLPYNKTGSSSSMMSSRTNCEFNVFVRNSRTRLLVSKTGGYDAWSKFNTANFARILPRSLYFSKRLAYSISDLISSDCSLGAEGRGGCVNRMCTKNRINYRKKKKIHFRHDSNSSPGGIRHKKA